MRSLFSAATLTHLALLGFVLGCRADRDPEPAFQADCLVKATANSGQPIAGSYIVTVDLPIGTLPAAPNARVNAAQAGAERLLSRYQMDNTDTEILAADAQTTFLAHLSPTEAAQLRTDPAVELVEPDRIMGICNCVDVATPTTLSWNIRQTGFGRGDVQTGKTAWVIDTGIDLTHPDLNVDAQRSRSFVNGVTSANDENGHGTHVAGIIGARNNGVGVTGIASGATLVALKVLNQLGEGRLSGIIQAVNHVRQNGRGGDVVNLSLGGEGVSVTLDNAIRQAANAGILFAIAAGNDGKDADDFSPARVNYQNVFTVSAIDRDNRFASFSNFGCQCRRQCLRRPDYLDLQRWAVRHAQRYQHGRPARSRPAADSGQQIAHARLCSGRSRWKARPGSGGVRFFAKKKRERKLTQRSASVPVLVSLD